MTILHNIKKRSSRSFQKKFKLSLFTLLSTIATSLYSIYSVESQLWFLPVLFGIVSLYGLFTVRKRPIDYGHLIAIFSFFFILRDASFSVLSLTSMILFFFLLFASWLLSRNGVFLISLELDTKSPDKPITKKKIQTKRTSPVTVFERESVLSLLKFTFFGVMLSLTCVFIAIYSPVVENIGGGYSELFFLIFGTITLYMLYLLLRVIPPYLEMEANSR